MQQRGDNLRPFELGVLLAGAWIANFLRVGASPLLWQDTLNDQRLVRLCLDHGHCSFAGAPVSFGHLWQGSTWHQLLTLFDWLGLDVSGVHLVMLVLDSAMLVLVAVAATRLAGRLAGLVAMVAALLLADGTDQFTYMLWNFRPLAFLAASALVLSLAGASSGRLRLVLLAAATAAVSTNVHMVSGVIVALPLAAALLADGGISRGRRLATGAATLGVFLAAVFLTSPAAWWHNLQVLFQGGWAPSGTATGSGGASVVAHPLVLAALTACALAAVTWVLAGPATRRGLVVLLAGFLPLLVVFIAAQSSSGINRTDRYLVPLLPAAATAIGAGCGVAVGRLTDKARRAQLVRKARGSMPWAAAALVCLLPAPGAEYAGFPLPTFREAGEVLALLRDDLGWDRSTAFRALKGPDDYLLLETMHVTRIAMASEGTVPPRHRHTRAYALKVRSEDVPASHPDVEVIGTDGEFSTVVVTTRAWLDWSHFQACTRGAGADTCLATGLDLPDRSVMKPIFAVRRMPDAGRILDQELVLRVPLHPPQGGPGDGSQRQRIRMPRVLDVCAGRVVEVPGEASRILDGGRAAELVLDGSADPPGEVVLSFRLGSPDCPRHTYRGFPPFLVEADPATMRLLASMLAPFERHEEGGR